MATPMNKTKTGANAVIFVALVILGLVAVNIVAARYFGRVDFTHDKIYTLSQPSKDLVAKLPDRLTVKAFISKDLQPPFSQVAQYTRDLIDEYATASKGKVVWEVIDPAGDSKLEEEANKLKVPKMRRGKISQNKVEIGASYLGVAFEYESNIESIPEINSVEGLEYQMTSLIKLLTQKKKKIGLAQGEGELSAAGGDPHNMGGGGGLQMISQIMKQYELVPVKLGEGAKPIPDDVEALVIAGPKTAFSERAKFELDQWIMKGKPVAMFVNGMVVESPRGMMMPGQAQPQIGRKNDHGLDDLLEHYGFKIKDDLILEPRQNAPGPVPVQGQVIPANYPTFVVATDIAKDTTITEGLQGVILPFVSSLELVAGKQAGLIYTPLFRSTKDAWRQSGFFLFDPENNKLKIGDERGPFTFGYEAKGKATSFFAGKPYPNEKGEKVPPPAPNSSVAPGEEKPLDESVGPVKIVLISDANFASDDYLRMVRISQAYQSDMLLFLNTLDELAEDPGLTKMRAKGVAGKPLTVGSEASQTALMWGNVIGVPLAFILFGVARWQLRNKRRRSATL
jgi:gliding motility-associatede transport system auxiliary component